jgi:hypothetical protein
MLKAVHSKQPNPAANPDADQTMPSFTWAELEEAMLTISASPRQRDMTPSLVSATRKQAPFLPRTQVLREILSLAWVVADESFGEAPDL